MGRATSTQFDMVREDAVDNDRKIAPAREQERVDAEIVVQEDAAGGEDERQAAEQSRRSGNPGKIDMIKVMRNATTMIS